MTGNTLKPVEIFYSYAHEDEPWRIELEKHLALLRRQGLISNWHDRLINPGTDWKNEVDTHLSTAQIILLLVSADFLDSDYRYSIELKHALKRHHTGKARVIPIILRPVDWQEGPFGHLQALPTNGMPVSRWPDRDEAFVNIARGIRNVIEELSFGIMRVSHVSPSEGLYRMAHELDSIKREIQPRIAQMSWDSAGVQGELVSSLIDTQQWARAEAMARSIVGSSNRTYILHRLGDELAKAEQWERAEAVAFTIEDTKHKDEALINLARSLAAAQEWRRAEAVARSITDLYKRRLILRELSLLFAGAGEISRAAYLAYDADTLVPLTHADAPQGLRPLARAPRLYSRRFSFTGLGCLLLAALSVGIIFAAPFIVRWYHTLTVSWLILLWSVVGVLLIGMIFIFVRIWWNRRL